jgi:large subunit ribosomal protein L11
MAIDNNAGWFKTVIPAGKAQSASNLPAILGQRGINPKDFMDKFNASTKKFEQGVPIPVRVEFNRKKKSFDIIVKTPEASYYIKQFAVFMDANSKSGSKTPGRDIVGEISKANLEKIVELKEGNMSGNTLEKNVSILSGTARSMGLKIVS